MLIISLAVANVKRISRRTLLWVFLFALPIVFALYYLLSVKTGFIKPPAYFLPVLCAVVVIITFLNVYKSDLSSGLVDGLKAAQLRKSELCLTYVIAGAFIYAVQMLIFIIMTKTLT